MTLFEQETPYGSGFGGGDAVPPRTAHEAPAAGVAQVIVTALLVVVSFAAGWFGNAFVNRTAVAHDPNERLILQAWDNIDKYYVVTSAIDHKKMAYSAIDAMVNSLGDTNHSRFETPEQIADEQKQLQNAPTVGIGVLISGGGQQPFRIEVIFPNSPAAKSSLQVGDIITAVNGQNVQGKTFTELRDLITGPANTNVTLTVSRTQPGGGTQTLDVTLKRAPYTPPTVESTMLPGTTIADISLLQFSASAGDDLRKALQDALSQQHATGVILDLRDNPGGYLDQAVSVASQFIPAGPGKNVLIQKTRDSSQPVPVQAGGLATKTPLVVLVNSGSASASEITAGAIKVDRPDAKIVGETTAGTGTILQTIYLADGSALVLGTGEWLLPNGNSIYHKGLTPEQPVSLDAGAEPLSPLVLQEGHYTAQQIRDSGDAQLLQAIQDLSGK